MVLPTPLCPRRSTLSPRSMKSREECKCSYRLRLMERGWFQSKRSRVANLPRVARRVRARRLRLSRSRRSISTSFSQTSTGPMRLLVVCSKKARKAGSDTRKPSCCNCVATSSFDIVASEVVRDHVSVRDVVAQGDEDGDGMLGGAAMLFAQDADFAGVVRAALDGFGDGFGEDVLAVKVEQFGGPGGHAADVAASRDTAVDKLKGETIEALKAQGMEYEQRMEELDKLEWPKPNRDFIYDTFNAFSDKHPWVGEENIAPKSVAREILERFCSFHDYVRDMGLQRFEGVLLRYLSEAYRALSRSVPVRFRSEAVEDLVASLGGVVRTVDSSLLEEWEEMRAPTTVAGGLPAALEPKKPRDPAADPRSFAARIRAELHRLLGALARRDFDEARAALRDDETSAWTSERLAAEMAPYFEEHKQIVVTPLARSRS